MDFDLQEKGIDTLFPKYNYSPGLSKSESPEHCT